MNFPLDIDVGVSVPIAPIGGKEFHNKKLCWQSHDDYYQCIDSQLEKGGESVEGKFI